MSEWLGELGEFADWRCPHTGIDGPCGAVATSGRWDCTATKKVPGPNAPRIAGGPFREADLVERPAAYSLTLTCENDHETYIRTEDVK